MKSWLWAVAPALLLLPANAYAGAACSDACTSFFGAPSCFSLGGLGCTIPVGQATGQCGTCTTNEHCAPFGTCSGGICLNTICGLDGGAPDAPPPFDSGTQPDASDVGPMEAGPDTGPTDGPVTDVDPSDAPGGPDIGPTDTGFQQDAVFNNGGGGGGPPPPDYSSDKKGCGCTTSAAETASPWAFLSLGLLLLRRRR